MIFTFQDVVDHLCAYLGADPSDQVQRDSREAAIAAYNEIVNAYNWSYLYTQGRIKTIGVWPPSQMDPSQPVPTIQTFESSGTYPYQVTLTGATWPSWAGTAYIRVGLVDYKVKKMIDSVTLTLDPTLSPVSDLPAGTQFALYYDTYLLPSDFISQDQAIYELNFGGLTFVHPRVWLFSTRYAFSWSQPQEFCVPTSHEILTRRGWKHYDEVMIGEYALAYNHETGELDWQTIEDVHVFDFDGELEVIDRPAKNKKFLCTKEHRWPVIKKNGKREIVKTRDFNTACYIPLSGNFKGTESVLSPRLAAILGWAVTDGSQLFNDKNHWNAVLYQTEGKYLNEIEELVGIKSRTYDLKKGGKTCPVIPIPKEDRKAIRDVIRSKSELPAIVCRLSRESANAMLDAMMKADGTVSKLGQRSFSQQHPDNDPVVEAFQILCLLTGNSANISRRPPGNWPVSPKCPPGFYPSTHDIVSCSINKTKAISPLKNGELKREKYCGKIWCPRIKWGTWVMRHNGHTIITGNTITGDSNYPGRLVMRVLPIPWESRTIDFIYKRRPRALTIPSMTGGTVSVSQGLNNLVGVGTAFTPNMVGMSIRLSNNATAPTSIIKGTNPAAFDTTVAAYVSPTALTLFDAANANYAGVGWTASDPIEFEQGAMLQAYLRCCEKQIGILRILKDKPSASAQYDQALAEAKSADSRSFAGKRPQQGSGRSWRLRDYNQGFSAPWYQTDGIYGG